MPRCIYCLVEKAENAFDLEHVFSRGLCGPNANWTLSQEVCTTCNSRFSAYEAHWMRQAIEATARNFHGLEGRNEQQRFDRPQPVEIDDLYILNKRDTTVYEAGFSFPADHHYRPQVVQLPSGLLCLATNWDDANALRTALGALPWQSIPVTIPQWRKRHADWLIAEIEYRPYRGYVITDFKREAKPRGLWLRNFPHDGLLRKNKLVEVDHVLTTRIALDHRKRLYLRAANIEAVPPFLTDLALNRYVTDTPPTVADGDQTLVFGMSLDLVKIYQAVLKNGFNLFTYFYGADAARDSTFDSLRKILVQDPTDRRQAMQHCRFLDANSADFPKSGNPKQHRLQLDLNDEGVIRFRIRLFDSLGYEALLGKAPEYLRQGFQTKRVAVDYLGIGIHEVQDW